MLDTDLTLLNISIYTLSNVGIVNPTFQMKELRLQRVNKLPHVLKLPQSGLKSHGLSFEPKLQTNPLRVALTQGIINTPGSWGFPSTRAPGSGSDRVGSKQVYFQMPSQLILIYQGTFLRKTLISISVLMVACYPIIIIRKQEEKCTFPLNLV